MIGGINEPVKLRKINEHTTEAVYQPRKDGRHIVMISYGGQEITKSPYEVNVGPYKQSDIVVYGPGLHGGVVDYPALFTVETNGETGALGSCLLYISLSWKHIHAQINWPFQSVENYRVDKKCNFNTTLWYFVFVTKMFPNWLVVVGSHEFNIHQSIQLSPRKLFGDWFAVQSIFQISFKLITIERMKYDWTFNVTLLYSESK